MIYIFTEFFSQSRFNTQIDKLTNDRLAFFEGFAANIFRDGKRPEGTEWVVEECKKLPVWISVAIYSDYLSSDYTDVLPTINVPTLVVNANSPVFSDGIN